MAKKRRTLGSGTIVKRRNKDGSVTYRGGFWGPDGKRHWVSDRTEAGCDRKLREAITDADRGSLPPPAKPTVEQRIKDWLSGIEGEVSRATYAGYAPPYHPRIRAA